MICCLTRRAIAVGLFACLLMGWIDRVFADTANVNNPNLQIYQLPKMQNAIDDKLKDNGANQNAPSNEGGTSDGVPDSEAGSSDDVQNGDTTEGDYDDTKSKKKQSPAVNIPLGPIINLIPPLIQQKQQQRPDLSFAQSAAKFDESTRQVALSFCVVNGGEGASKETKVAIRSSGQAVGTYTIEPLSPGEQACRGDISASVSAGFAGTRRYELIADPSKVVSETREDNNTGGATVEIKSLPDLTIASFSAKSVAGSRKVALALCIANLGKSVVDRADVSIRDSSTGDVVASTSLGPLPAGGRLCPAGLSATVPAAFNGKRVYDAQVDPQSRIAESNEDNNSTTATAIDNALPDLAIAEATVSFDEVIRQAVLSYCVVNRGKVAVKQTDVSIRDQAGANAVASPTVSAIAPGAQVCQKNVAAVPAGFVGTRKYKVVVDSQRRISEADEGNNTASIALKIQATAKPDLAFTDASARFDEVAREMVMSFCVINRGQVSSAETRVSIHDTATGAEIQSPRIAPLASDQRTCRDGLLLLVASEFSGAQRYELSVDPDGKVGESDETNNAAQAEARVSAPANLAFANSSTRFDETARRALLSFCVANRGEAASNEGVVSIRDSGTVATSLKVEALSASNQACFSDVAMPALEDFAGTRSYELVADGANSTGESNENDNTRTVSVAVPELPAPTEYVTAAGPSSEPAHGEPTHMPLGLVVIAIAGAAVLSGGIVFVLVRPRRGKQAEHVQPESIQFRGRPDPGTQITQSAAAEIVFPRLQLCGHADSGRQHIEMREAAMRITGE